MNPFNFAKYVKIKRIKGDQIHAHCPFHDDRSPSFSANFRTGQWKCFAGCGEGGYTLFTSMYEKHYLRAEEYLETEFIFSRYTIQSLAVSKSEYYYVDENLEVRQKISRIDYRDGSKKFYQQCKNNFGIWATGKYQGILAPYLYQKWAEQNGILYFVEGEKCANYLDAMGLNATTVLGGTNGWKNDYAKFFTNRRVIILPDNDEPGLLFAEAVHLSLQNYAVSRILFLPGLQDKEDVVDWFDRSDRNTMDALNAFATINLK